MGYPTYMTTEEAANYLTRVCHEASRAAGWWQPADLEAMRERTRFGMALVGQKLALIHSEVSEALEGERKNKMDDHLPHRRSAEVELADAMIRICDLAGAMGLDLGGAMAEKMAYNAKREDHKIEVRQQNGGKAF